MLHKVWNQNSTKNKQTTAKSLELLKKKGLCVLVLLKQALARFRIFLRMETSKVGKPYDYMEMPPPPPKKKSTGAPRLVTD